VVIKIEADAASRKFLTAGGRQVNSKPSGQMEDDWLAFAQNMKWKIFSLVAGVLLLFAGYEHWKNRPTQQDVIQKVFNNQQNLDVLIASTNATAQLLHARQDIQFNKGQSPGKLNGYTLDAPIALPIEKIQDIQGLLQSPSSYEFRYSKACIPDYGILLTFHSNKKLVRIALCFKCDILGVFTDEGDDAESTGGGDFDPSHRKLVVLVKTIFPNDKEIQSLK
jgi:hypothetical protein